MENRSLSNDPAIKQGSPGDKHGKVPGPDPALFGSDYLSLDLPAFNNLSAAVKIRRAVFSASGSSPSQT
jgi:hypothetical protein